jgi:hypothetical protein
MATKSTWQRISSGTLTASSDTRRLPAVIPLPRHVPVGTATYYQDRQADFKRRHPDLAAPDYYMAYGDKYYRRFTTELRPKLSAQGKLWVDRASLLFQERIEARVGDTVAEKLEFDRLEKDGSAFREFAFGTHCGTYIEAGVADLPESDLWEIYWTPDLADMVSPEGREQLMCVASKVAPKEMDRIIRGTGIPPAY